MASSIPKVRFVRCPKCLKVITEFAEVPMYQCGGCGKILQAKNYNAAAGDITMRSSSTDDSQNLPDYSSSSNVSTSLGAQVIPSSSKAPSTEVDHEEEQIRPPNLFTSSTNVEHKHEEKEETESGSNETEVKCSTKYSIQSQLDESIQRKGEYFLGEKVEKPLKPIRQDPESTRASDKLEEKAKSNRSAALADMVDAEVGNGNGDVLRSPATRSFRAYDGSVSSSDDGSNVSIPNKYRLLSRRTFRNKKVLDSVDNKTKEDGKKALENNFSLMSSNEKHASAIRGSLNSKQDWETSFSSEDFQTVQNWMGKEKDEPSQTQIDGPSTEFKYVEHDRLELLRTVDELRDQLSGLCDQRRERKTRSYYRGVAQPPGSYYRPRETIPQMNHFSELPLPIQAYCSCLHCLPPHLCYNNGLCMACPPGMCFHPAKAGNQLPHMDSNISSPYYKAQIQDHDSEKVHSKEKKPVTKRHCRPILGAAPFIICYKCFELLKVPADFLMPRWRSRKLQCGACSEILTLPYQDSAHLDLQKPFEAVHPPSEIDNMAHAGGKGDPFSYTEEYGPSFSKSYSTDAETVLHVPQNSFQALKERYREEPSGMTLHRLMGYSSARDILYQPSDGDEGYARFRYKP